MAGHPYRIREIAEQAGLGQATVDRVLNGRPGVRQTTVAEVHQAIADLDRQRSQLSLAGRTFLVDLVMQAPHRFSTAVRRAMEGELPGLRPAVVRSRYHLGEEGDPDAVVRTCETITRKGSPGCSSRPRTIQRWPRPPPGWSTAGSRWSRCSPTSR
jgi:LacI family transcriptional regulator